MENLNDFTTWSKDVQKQIEDWTGQLVHLAKQKNKYSSALTWLSKNEPDFPISYNASTSDIFNTLIRNMFEDAKKQIRDEAMGNEIKEN